MANAASNSRIRAELYAAAEYYLRLSEVEGNLTGNKSEPMDEPQNPHSNKTAPTGEPAYPKR